MSKYLTTRSKFVILISIYFLYIFQYKIKYILQKRFWTENYVFIGIYTDFSIKSLIVCNIACDILIKVMLLEEKVSLCFLYRYRYLERPFYSQHIFSKSFRDYGHGWLFFFAQTAGWPNFLTSFFDAQVQRRIRHFIWNSCSWFYIRYIIICITMTFLILLKLIVSIYSIII